MSDRRAYVVPAQLLAVFWLVASGCDMLQKAGLPGMERYVKRNQEEVDFERDQRDKFSLNHDRKALFWLLANRIENGMRLSEVEQILGESGEYASENRILKSEVHQTTDSAYSWGPDSEGRSVILFFRDGNLTNFNPKDYRKP